jgi:hypothetical protein
VKVTAADLHEWKTPEGIGLGSSAEEVMKAYCKPSDEGRSSQVPEELIARYRKGDKAPDVGDWVLIYGGPELSRAWFVMRNGKVSCIWWSDSE